MKVFKVNQVLFNVDIERKLSTFVTLSRQNTRTKTHIAQFVNTAVRGHGGTLFILHKYCHQTNELYISYPVRYNLFIVLTETKSFLSIIYSKFYPKRCSVHRRQSLTFSVLRTAKLKKIKKSTDDKSKQFYSTSIFSNLLHRRYSQYFFNYATYRITN